MSWTPDYFEDLYSVSPDPWDYRNNGYEKRKREILLASLQKPSYDCIFEAGCSNGETSRYLAPRTRRLFCCDSAAGAVSLCQEKLLPFAHASVFQAVLPHGWPPLKADLIVFSEMGYYLDTGDLLLSIEKISEMLTDEGEIIACHWKKRISGCQHSGNEVHQMMDRHLALGKLVEHEEADFILSSWSRDGRSSAVRFGISG